MFGSKKKNTSGIADDLYEFLCEADALYIRAFETRSIGILKDFFTRNCCMSISRWIVAEASTRYFSEERFRNTTWEVTEHNDTSVKFRKKCVYRDVRLTLNRKMKISEDYDEIWTILISPEEYWVDNIQPCT